MVSSLQISRSGSALDETAFSSAATAGAFAAPALLDGIDDVSRQLQRKKAAAAAPAAAAARTSAPKAAAAAEAVAAAPAAATKAVVVPEAAPAVASAATTLTRGLKVCLCACVPVSVW